MDSDRVHTGNHRVRFDECDAGGSMRPSALLRAVQDLAWQHSTAAGFDRDWYRLHGLTWLVRFADLQMTHGVDSGSTLHMTTTITGLRRVWARRETFVHVGDHARLVGRTTIDWVIVDGAGRPTRVPEAIVQGFHEAAPTFAPSRVHLQAAPPDSAVEPWVVGVRDLDPMAHVNNATYLDIMDEILASATGALTGPNPPVRYEVEYLRSALPRTVVSIRHWVDGPATAFQLTDDSGAELIRARVEPG